MGDPSPICRIFAGAFPARPLRELRWSEPEKPNDIKSLIDLNILKVV
jgi:hypothetical protein